MARTGGVDGGWRMADSTVTERGRGRGDSGLRGRGLDGPKRAASADDVAGYVKLLLTFGGVILAAICVFATMSFFLRRRRKYDPKASLFELLEKSRELEEQGELEPSEYQAIRCGVSERSRQLSSETTKRPTNEM